MKRNCEWAVGDRVMWLPENGSPYVGVVIEQYAGATYVKWDGEMGYTKGFAPLNCDLLSADAQPMRFTYTNHAGRTEARQVLPMAVWHGTTTHYTTPRWLLRCWCLDRKAVRDFDLGKMVEGK